MSLSLPIIFAAVSNKLKESSLIALPFLSTAITTITGVAQDGADPASVIITGTNLIPYFGEVRVTLSNNFVSRSDREEHGVYLFSDVQSITDTEIIINTDIASALADFKYRIRLNGLSFSGTGPI